MTVHEPVTGASERRAEFDATGTLLVLPRLEALTSAGGYPCLLALEIDEFRLIVHLHGAEAAEVISRHLASAINASLGAGDRPLRTGPGQYALLLTGGLEAGERLARSVGNAFGQKAWPGLGELTVSAALAQRYPAEAIAGWWRRVESALAQAKAGGGGHVVVDRRRSEADGAIAAPGLHLRWQARFECGEPTIDRQHRELFERSEEILESLRLGGTRVVPDLERLIDEIGRHFVDEEHILELKGYADLEGHRRSHGDLAGKLRRLQAAVISGSAEREDLTRFLLGEVVADHMLTEDRRFAQLFGANAALG
jgi:hemerythrin